jgi:hypothetical protein
MCHGVASAAFPPVGKYVTATAEPFSLAFGDSVDRVRIAILPDIYGPGPFYQGLATYLAGRGAFVQLMDPFHGLGPINLRRLAEIAGRTPGFGLHVFPGSGHGFLGDLDCDDAARAQNARSALTIVEETMFVRRADAAGTKAA